MIELWTDGATSKNGSKNAIGGWAYVLVRDGEILFKGHGAEFGTTNNRCEYLAMINGLKHLEEMDMIHETINCYSDSALLINTLNTWIHDWKKNNWTKKSKGEIKNLDLVKALYPYTQKDNIVFSKVAGHAGVAFNEMCDKLAVFSRKLLEEKIDFHN